MEIIRGTTPTIIYNFSSIDAENITVACLVVKQKNVDVIEKSLANATVSEGALIFTLTQEDTLALQSFYKATIILDWKTADGTRGRANIYEASIGEPAKDEVL